MFVGQGRAGKTSTINSLLHLPFNNTEESTVVADAKGQIAITTTDVSVTSWQKKDYVNNPINSDFKETVLNFKHKGDNMLVNMPRARRLNERAQLERSKRPPRSRRHVGRRKKSSIAQSRKASVETQIATAPPPQRPVPAIEFSRDLQEAVGATATEVQREIVPIEKTQEKVKGKFSLKTRKR